MGNIKKRIIIGILTVCIWIVCGGAAGLLMLNHVPFPPSILILLGAAATFILWLVGFVRGAEGGRKRASAITLSFTAAIMGYFGSDLVYRLILDRFFYR